MSKVSPKRKFLIAILIWLAVILVLFFAVDKLLNYYSRIGEESVVPNITGLPLQEAIDTLTQHGLTFSIQDTQRTDYLPTGHVLFQIPAARVTIKSGRTISLIISSFNAQKNVMPNIIGEKFRSAAFKLQSLGIRIKDTIWVDSVSLGTVCRITLADKDVPEGVVLSPKDAIAIYVGSKKEMQIEVPDLTGLTEVEARIVLQSRGLELGEIFRTEETQMSAVVYRQEPAAQNILQDKNTLPPGGTVTIWVK